MEDSPKDGNIQNNNIDSPNKEGNAADGSNSNQPAPEISSNQKRNSQDNSPEKKQDQKPEGEDPENPENMEGNQMEGQDENQDEDNEDLFDGDYEEFEDKSLYGDPEFQGQTTDDFSSVVVNRRTELYKVIIVRPKREFEAPILFNDKGPGEEGNGSNFEFKTIKASEFPCGERCVIEMGFQTNNESHEKSYQVPRQSVQNAITSVEKGLGDIMDKLTTRVNSNLNDPNKMTNMESFLHKVRSRMEEALQSNETIDIFQNDFDLSRVVQNENQAEKKSSESEAEIRTFRDNILAGQKSKKEKSVNYIRLVKSDEVYIAHSLIRNLSFEERSKIIGIPYQSQILFWDFVDPEINSQVFSLEIPMEITCFEFNPTNQNQVVCALTSGQLIIYEIKDLIGILKGNLSGDHAKKSMFYFKII